LSSFQDISHSLKKIDKNAERTHIFREMGKSGIKVQHVMRVMGLTHVKDTVVGDALLRGVSGGQKKRVTISEMVVGGQNVFLMDEISTGLDTSTT
jgi:ABC-type multidrug transport system ATPase subunit